MFVLFDYKISSSLEKNTVLLTTLKLYIETLLREIIGIKSP